MEGFKSSLDQAKEVSEATATLERITSSLDGNQTDTSSTSTPTDADSVTTTPSLNSRHDSSSPASVAAAVVGITTSTNGGGYDLQVRPGPRYGIVDTSGMGQQVKHQVVQMQQPMHMRQGAKRKYYVSHSNPIEGYDANAECMYPLECVEEKMNRRNAYCSQPTEPKIPRPPNAFMIYANEFRRVLAAEYPKESNKEISVRLGTLWKHMTKDAKDKYFGLSRVVDAEHKKRYPNYVYNPKEARMRKAIRDQNREHNRMFNGKSPSPTKLRNGNTLIMHAGDAAPGSKPQHVRVLDNKPRKMPLYHPQQHQQQQHQQQQQQWQEGGGGNNQYVGAESFLEMPFQSHDGTAYSSIVSQQTPWYPYMQQDGTPQYPHQVWSHHAPPAYAAQQRMQYMAAHGGQEAAAQGYMNYESAAHQHQQQQQQAAGQTRPTNGVDSNEGMPITTTSTPSTSFQEQRPNMTTAPTSTANFPRPPLAAATKSTSAAPTTATKPQPSSQATQTPVYPVSPQMSPTKAYHKYLQGNELSPTTNWPSLYCMYSPQDEEGRLAVANRSPGGMPGEKPPFNYYNNTPPHQFTYYDYIVPGPEFMPHPQNFGNTVGGFTPQMFPPVSKAREFALGLREFITPTIKKRSIGFPQDEDPLSIAENAVLNSPRTRSPDEYTVVVNVVNDDTAKRSGGRVIATYETQNNNQDIKDDEKNETLFNESSGKENDKLRDDTILLESDNDLADNSTFSFMQDPAYKNILTSIDANENSKIIQQNDNVCVMTNDAFDDQRSNFSCMSPESNPDGPAK